MNTKDKQVLALGGLGIAALLVLPGLTTEDGGGVGELWADPSATPLGFIPKFFEPAGKPGGVGLAGTPKSSEINKIIAGLPQKETFTGFKSPFGNEMSPAPAYTPTDFFTFTVPDIATTPKKETGIIKPLSESTIPVIVPPSKKVTPSIVKKLPAAVTKGTIQTLAPTFSFTLAGLGAALKAMSSQGLAPGFNLPKEVKTYESHGAPYIGTDYDTKKAATARQDVSTWTQVKTYESHGAPYIGTDYTTKKAAAARQDVSTWSQVSTPTKKTTTTPKKTSSRQKYGKTSGSSRSYSGGKRVR